MENADIRTADGREANKTFRFMSLFSTLVENAETLENTRKTHKNALGEKGGHADSGQCSGQRTANAYTQI